MTKFKVSFVGAIAAVFALVASSSADAAYMHSVALKMGSRNAQVMELQKALNATSCKVAASGVGSAGMESMYFGAMTKAAVQCFQAANGLTADGIVGAMTGAKLAAAGSTSGSTGSTTGSTSGSTGSTSGVSLSGGAGSVQSYELASGINNEEVGEGENDVKVAGLEIEADESSDLRLTAVKLVFNEGTAASDFEDYADSVSVWLGSTKVASVDGDDFNDNNDWTRTVSLDSAAIVKADKTETLYVAVSGIDNLDGTDAGDTWTVDFSSVRFVDAQGASTTEDPATAVRTFSFESFATASDAELKLALNDDEDDVNDARIVEVDATDDTDNVSVLAFTLEAEGDSDLVVDEIPVLFTATGASNVDDLITEATLYMGDKEIGSESIPATAGATETITFDDLDVTIDAGDEEKFWVKVNFQSVADALDEGDTLRAQITGTELNAMDVEDEAGDNLATGKRSGTASADAHAVYENGIKVEFVSASATKSFSADDVGESDKGQFKISFKVTAFGSDLRLDRPSEEGGADAAGQGAEYTITNSGSNATTSVLTSASTDTEDNANVFELDEDVARTFTLTVEATASATAFAEVALESLNWGTSTSATTNANYYTFNLNDFKTDAISLTDL